MGRTKILTCALMVFACGCSTPPRIVVGSKNFTEQLVLGEIVSQQIERRLGVHVDRRLNLGGTLLAQQALISGAIDLYPEYTGTALTTILKRTPGKDRNAVFREVQEQYATRFRLQWLRPFGFNNTFAMIVRKADGSSFRTLSQAAGRSWRLGAGYEFLKRPDGFEGLVKTYGLKTEGSPVTMDLGLLYTALQNRQVDMVAGNATDGLLSVLDVTELEDDRQYFPPYECAVVIRDETLARFPGARAALEELSGKLPSHTMRKLNYAVDGEHRPLREVAASFLRSLSPQ